MLVTSIIRTVRTLTSDWIRIYHPGHADAPRLVCLAHAGGSATAFFGLAKRLSPSIEVLAIQYPGRQDRRHTPPIIDIRDLADGVYSALAAFRDRPIALFGHSMGALVGYELALRFERESDGRLLGFVPSARRAPSVARPEPVPLNAEELMAKLQELSGTDARVLRDEGMLELILPALRADYQAVARYRHDPESVIHCPTTVCVGDEDPLTSADEARAWREHVEASFNLRVFQGGHFYVNACEDMLAQVLIELIGDWVGEITIGSPES